MKRLVRSGSEVELERGGQVYFVHNRVESIYEIAARIQELVPAARVIVGHGKWGKAELGTRHAGLHESRVRCAGRDYDH